MSKVRNFGAEMGSQKLRILKFLSPELRLPNNCVQELTLKLEGNSIY